MKCARKHNLVCSIYPTTRGFAFVLFEGPLAPVDWGLSEIRGVRKNARCLKRIAALIKRYQPNMVVLEDTSEGSSRRAPRIRRLNSMIANLAEDQGIETAAISRGQVRQCFAHLGTPTKHVIAQAIARHIPAFERYLPPKRKLWQSEDPRQAIFDSAALVFAFYSFENKRKKTA